MFVGSLIPLLIYILWEFLISGVVPIQGVPGLINSWKLGENAVKPVQILLSDPWISLAANFLAFFVIVTSFLGVALSLTDFLADGFKIEKSNAGRIILSFLAFAPSLTIALVYPRAFLSALEYAGAFGVAILLGILPAAMVWSGRYRLKYEGEYRAPGGKFALSCVILFFFFVIILEIIEKLGWLTAIKILLGS